MRPSELCSEPSRVPAVGAHALLVAIGALVVAATERLARLGLQRLLDDQARRELHQIALAARLAVTPAREQLLQLLPCLGRSR